MNSSDLLHFLKTRSSVRSYSAEPLEPEDIEYILACASTAPSAGNRESWDVVLVTDEDLRMDLALAAFEQQQIQDAPAIFVVCANYVRSMSHYGERGILYALEDATIACIYDARRTRPGSALMLDRGVQRRRYPRILVFRNTSGRSRFSLWAGGRHRSSPWSGCR